MQTEKMENQQTSVNSGREQTTVQKNGAPQSMPGWIMFFLVVGVGLGSIVSFITIIGEAMGSDFSLLLLSLFFIDAFSFLATAVYTIYAFAKRKSNAVSVATTYIAMIVIDGIMGLILSVVLDETSELQDTIRQFVWGLVWFSFLRKYKKVEEWIPKENRTWKLPEKIILAVYILETCIVTGFTVYVADSGNSQLMMKTDAFVESVIEEGNKLLPMDCGSGITFNSIAKDGDRIVYTYQFSNLAVSDFDMSLIESVSVEDKAEMLDMMLQEPADFDFIVNTCFKDGYVFEKRYIDSESVLLFSYTITSEEYNAALENQVK